MGPSAPVTSMASPTLAPFVTGTRREAGLYVIRYTGSSGTPSGVTIAGVQPPHTWQDLVAWLPTADPTSDQPPPDWIVVGPSTGDAAGNGAAVTAAGSLDPGIHGPVCLVGNWPDITFVPGTPFEVAAAAG